MYSRGITPKTYSLFSFKYYDSDGRPSFRDYFLAREATDIAVHPSAAITTIINKGDGLHSLNHLEGGLGLMDAAWKLYGMYEIVPFFEQIKHFSKRMGNPKEVLSAKQELNKDHQLIYDYPASAYHTRQQVGGRFYCRRSMYHAVIASETFKKGELHNRNNLQEDEAEAFCERFNAAMRESFNRFLKREQQNLNKQIPEHERPMTPLNTKIGIARGILDNSKMAKLQRKAKEEPVEQIRDGKKILKEGTDAEVLALKLEALEAYKTRMGRVVAKEFNVSHAALTAWKRTYAENGIAGLLGRQGRPSRVMTVI